MTAGTWRKAPQDYELAVDVAASTDERTVLCIWKLTDGAPRIIATISDPPQRAAEQVIGLLPGLLMGHNGGCPCARVRRADPYPTCTCGADMHNARLDELRRSLDIADPSPVPKIRIVTRKDCPPDVIAMSGDGGKTWGAIRVHPSATVKFVREPVRDCIHLYGPDRNRCMMGGACEGKCCSYKQEPTLCGECNGDGKRRTCDECPYEGFDDNGRWCTHPTFTCPPCPACGGSGVKR